MRPKQILMAYIYCTPIILGWQDVSRRMSLDYFEGDSVKFLCSLSCHLNHSILDFVKTAFTKLIGVSHVNIEPFDETRLRSCLKQPMTIVGIMLDVSCPGYKEVMAYASSNKLLDANHKWLLIHDVLSDEYNVTESVGVTVNTNFEVYRNKEDREVIEVLEEIDSSVDADITVARRIGAEQFDLREVFNFGKTRGGQFVVNKLGIWNTHTGLEISKHYKYYRRWNFQNMTMRMIAVMSEFPKNFSKEMLVGRIPAPGVLKVTQIGATILHEVAGLHNIRFNYTITDRWIGIYERNATRVVTNSMYFEEQDITPFLRFFTFTLDRVDMLHQVSVIEIRYYYRIPSQGAGKFQNKFLTPLSAQVWWCVIAMSVACGIVLMLTAILEHHPTSAQYAVFSVIASIGQQFFEDVESMRVQRSSTTGKLTILVIGLFCVLLYNYYTSSVVSWLLNGPPPSINSLWELLESPLKLVYEDAGYCRTWIKIPEYTYNKRNEEVEYEMKRRKVWNKKKGEPLLVTVSEGTELLKGGEYAYHVEVKTANKLISENFDQKEICELDSLSSMEPTKIFSAIQRKSPFKEFYIWSMSRLDERGLISCIQSRVLVPKMVCQGTFPRAMALGGAAPAFILLGFGYILGLFIIVMERLVYEKKILFIQF